ncbi:MULTISPECIES: ATP-grasp domain-containing protein [unclassified Halanaerobium]|uniref:ATP-grasp domain-containing protein n=1 Tax=unclassified Halanaerobium TaxID=2641197 RepID=UPI000DF46F18|nr:MULTISPECIES: ATP-grasp domain-containing protein [unclassified Halanaerobium]RCW46327.1 biotin carboxylase [Halanaerobium sp. MA284_MarDTE_T2]RCW84931.1 biotin carboxylase [Halanaerobium sp. DL-01]
MKLLVLGGGSGQISIIKKAKEMGHQVIVSDYYADAPGKKYADYGETVSTFDIKSNIEVAKKYSVDGVLTSGTDQPVYTAARTAEELNLPSFLSSDTALKVTNKMEMKKLFEKADIPSVKHKFLQQNFLDRELEKFSFPAVVKPLDSQGQRGVFKLNSIEEVRKRFAEVLSFSRENKILIEEYYNSGEITVSGWVNKGKLKILTITDRVTYENGPHIGICTAHIFPSKFLSKYHQEIKSMSEKIVKAFQIKNGPIYFQMLIGDNGIKVNEIACRIGGAYEGDFMPSLTGVDILEMMVNLALNQEIDYSSLNRYQLKENQNWLSVQLFFALPGRIADISSTEEILSLDGVSQIGFNFKKGDKIKKIENATERAGYFIVRAESRTELKERLKKVYDRLKIVDNQGKNLIIREIGEVF